jgi:hypothetical protein
MKTMKLIGAIVLSAACSVRAQETRPADVRTFELTAVAPPKPALKYQLTFDDLADRRPGNAAILYLDSILIMGPEAKEKAQKALDAYDAKDLKTFDSMADALQLPNLFSELDLAARRETCDWQPPMREMGAYTLLPHLEPIVHGLARLVRVRALREIEQGRAPDAINTLRLGYVMANYVGREPTLVSSLVSLAMTTQMNDALAQLMSRSESPNLYWALSELPSQQEIYRHALDGERSYVVPSTPALMRLRQGEENTPQQWRELLDYIWRLVDVGNESPEAKRAQHRDPIKDTPPQVMEEARKHYAQTHQLSAEQVTKIDPLVIVGNYFWWEYQVWFDEQYKLRGLPYPLLMAKAAEQAQEVAKIRNEQPANPFQLWGINKTIDRFARVDRQFAALIAVEAIRSYAAEHNGQLPAKLSDVTTTPVPKNPVTGKPFEYRVESATATLSDSQVLEPLTYTIKIRK